MEIIIIFKHRSEALKCSNFLRAVGHKATLQDAPLKIVNGCSLTVKTNEKGYEYFIANVHGFNAFVGAYKVEGKGEYTRII